MGCGSCSSSAGCGKKGGCSSGGCNRMNTYNWLSTMPISIYDEYYPYVEVSFNNGSRKDFFNKPQKLEVAKGDLVVVEGVGGFDIGSITLTGELAKLQIKKKNIKTKPTDFLKVLRIPAESELELYEIQKGREKEILMKSRDIINEEKLKMKLAEVEVQADGKKATFFYSADERIDFRELIKKLAAAFRVRVEMKQIGSRQEASKVGGIGSCGRELCCSTWLSDFKSVGTNAARYQNLSINQLKLSGQCGRLKCCLNYELDAYMEALQAFPKHADKIQTELGTAFLVKTDIFKNLMWYVYENQSRFIPLTIESVIEIQNLNKQGQKPKELAQYEVEEDTTKDELEPKIEYEDLVGQFSLRSLDRASKKRKKKSQTNPNNPNQNKQSARPRQNSGNPNPNQKKQYPPSDANQNASTIPNEEKPKKNKNYKKYNNKNKKESSQRPNQPPPTTN